MVTNLISNSKRYADEKYPIVLTADSTPDKKYIIIGVKDVGPGIPEENRSRLFTKFGNNLSRNKSNDSSRLGLYIYKNIIEKQGGEIWLDTDYEEGCHFKFKIPRNMYR